MAHTAVVLTTDGMLDTPLQAPWMQQGSPSDAAMAEQWKRNSEKQQRGEDIHLKPLDRQQEAEDGVPCSFFCFDCIL